MTAIPNRIRELRRARNLSMEALALEIGTSAPTVNKLEKGQMRLSDRWLAPLAVALGVTPGALLGDDSGERSAPPAPQIPVYGLAAGAFNGLSRMDADPVEWLDCPPALSRVKGAYALIVKGVSMEPRFQNGDLVFINPNRPPRPGDDVIIQVQVHAQAPTETWIKRLLREEAETLTVRQFNPLAEMSFKRAHVKALHRVLTVNELFG